MSTETTFTEVKPPAMCCGARLSVTVSDDERRIVDLPAACRSCGHRFAVQELVALRELSVGMWKYVDAGEHGVGPF